MTETLPRIGATRSRAVAPLYVLLCVAMLAALSPFERLLDAGPFTDFTVRNDTVWSLDLGVRTGERSRRDIATIGRRSERHLPEVLVPGDTWEFIWGFAGEDIGTSTVSDDELRSPNFVLDVPAEVLQALRSADAPATP